MANALAGQDRQRWLAFCGLAIVATVSLGPLLIEPTCSEKPLHLDFLPPYSSAWAAWAGKSGVALAMLLSIIVYVRHRPGAELWLIGICIGLAGAMTALHWLQIDSNPTIADWQRNLYLKIINHRAAVPHHLRPLPYGFTRFLEWITHDWVFSFLAYRWFFSFWFLLFSYQFARFWLSPKLSFVTVGVMWMLYHYSIQTYWGQLTDPLSHWLLVMALVFVVEDQWLLLAVTLGLGVVAKETAVLIVPAYGACWWRNGWPAVRKTAALGAVCVAAFLAARLPYGWWPQYEQINGTHGSMIWANLGIPHDGIQPWIPIRHQYFHLTLFFFVFIPGIVLGWRHLDHRLKALCLTVAPLVLMSNLWFGWVHESRNYMPLAPLLATSALMVFQRADQRRRQPAGLAASEFAHVSAQALLDRGNTTSASSR